MTYKDFQKKFPDENICLEYIFQHKFSNTKECPSCKKKFKYYRVKSRKSYECGECSHQIYPMKGTIFEDSTTALCSWFFTIYLFSVSKNGVSAKEIQRQIGVTYKCAWRIGHKIRTLMNSGTPTKLNGIVEVDETLIGGRVSGGKRGWGAENKTCLLGMIERDGKVKVITLPNRERETIFPILEANIEKGTVVNTDEFRVYSTLPTIGFEHQKVNHSKYQWKNGDAYTNSIEGYWSNIKKSIFGTHTFVSPKHLPKYLGEFDFRHNHRKGFVMFDEIMKKI